MDPFLAYRIDQRDGKIVAELHELSLDDLSEGEVVIEVSHSTINYKDALAATGKGKILRKFPLVGGIDLAGKVVSSSSDRFREGDAVVVNGCGLSETRDGGYARYARVPADCVIAIPEGLSPFQTMQIGTAGYTAALAVHRMEENGQTPDGGPVIVTGATGGVGSLAVDMLSARGYEVVAVTGKKDRHEYLEKLGATRVLDRGDIDYGSRPLEKAQWAGAVDNLGGETLAWLTRTTQYGGNIASIGLAESHELHTTVMPFILRAVNLLGINSVDTPRELRETVWSRIADDLKPRHLDAIASRVVRLEELPGAFEEFLRGEVTGRVVVEIA